MPVRVIDPPQPIVSVDEAKEFARIDGDDHDLMIEALIASAQSEIDGPSGWLGRAFGEQRIEATFCRFEQFHLPYPRIVEVEAIDYIDPNGVAQVVDPSWYQTDGRDVLLSHGSAWPSARVQDNAVRVTYLAGEEIGGADLERARVAIMTNVALNYDGEHEQADRVFRLMVQHLQVYA